MVAPAFPPIAGYCGGFNLLRLQLRDDQQRAIQGAERGLASASAAAGFREVLKFADGCRSIALVLVAQIGLIRGVGVR